MKPELSRIQSLWQTIARSFTLMVFLGSPLGALGSEMLDYYQILDVTRDATPKQIFGAYIKQRFRFNIIRSLASRTALQRRAEIEMAYDALKNDESRALYDRMREDHAHAAKRVGLFEKLRDKATASRIKTDTQIAAIQIAARVRGADIVTTNFEDLLRFNSSMQVAALRMISEVHGAAVASIFDEILKFDSEYQVEALRFALRNFKTIPLLHVSDFAEFRTLDAVVALVLVYQRVGLNMDWFIRDIARINTPEGLNRLVEALKQPGVQVGGVVQHIAATCEPVLA